MPKTISSAKAPLISVVIPCYNRANLISRAVRSVRIQDFSDLEVVLVDDGSSDDTILVIEALMLSDPRIRLVKHEKNKGEAAARNTGVRSARGEYVAFLDSDDEWLPGKLSAQIAEFDRLQSSVAAVACGYVLADERGNEVIASDWSDAHPVTCANILTKGCGLSSGTTLMVRRAVFESIGYFDESLPLLVDIDWLCRLTNQFTLAKISNPLARYFKAPMRRGEPMELAVSRFEQKNARMLSTFSVLNRFRIKSKFYGYISLGYAAHGPWRKFVATRALHFLFNPLQHPGNYVHFLLALIGITPIGKRA